MADGQTAQFASPAAARVAGVRVQRVEVLTYIVATIAYAVAGMLLAGYVETAAPMSCAP